MSYFRLFKELLEAAFAKAMAAGVGRSGFEPLKSKDSGFTVRPIWPLWNLPSFIF